MSTSQIDEVQYRLREAATRLADLNLRQNGVLKRNQQIKEQIKALQNRALAKFRLIEQQQNDKRLIQSRLIKAQELLEQSRHKILNARMTKMMNLSRLQSQDIVQTKNQAQQSNELRTVEVDTNKEQMVERLQKHFSEKP